MPKKPVSGGGVTTNYGAGVLVDGTKITFIKTDLVRIETPIQLKGKVIEYFSGTGITAIWKLV